MRNQDWSRRSDPVLSFAYPLRKLRHLERLAKAERRNRSSLLRVLIEEALAAREALARAESPPAPIPVPRETHETPVEA